MRKRFRSAPAGATAWEMMMGTTFGHVWPMMTSRRFWTATLKVGLLAALAAAVLLTAIATFLVVLPLALAGGLALHLYLRRKLRHVRRSSPRPLVIEGQYTVLEW